MVLRFRLTSENCVQVQEPSASALSDARRNLAGTHVPWTPYGLP